MEYLYNFSIAAVDSAKLENVFNIFRVGLNKWNKSEVYSHNNIAMLNYAVVCDERTMTNVCTAMQR